MVDFVGSSIFEFQQAIFRIDPTVKAPSSSCEHWTAPDVGCLKLNIDVAISEDYGWIGIGAVVRDLTGRILAVCCKKLKGLFDSYTIKLLAMRESLYFAIDSGFIAAVLENDSLKAVLVVHTKSNDLFATSLIVADIISLLSINGGGFYNFVRHSGNKVAHSLAKFSSSMFWYEEIPNCIINLVANDLHF
ncbi:Ribonuclease H-like domain containing protein [Parasponia andersonii]|uniref:Ribonuclease H-like domain containing protein n=1 Tax=Parasponia andersonii TaxID=3476 RepID=A0A2P5C600_PARAD|nr:Ribonuclease H-like domain containing protein [Parasponia andersonii]